MAPGVACAVSMGTRGSSRSEGNTAPNLEIHNREVPRQDIQWVGHPRKSSYLQHCCEGLESSIAHAPLPPLSLPHKQKETPLLLPPLPTRVEIPPHLDLRYVLQGRAARRRRAPLPSLLLLLSVLLLVVRVEAPTGDLEHRFGKGNADISTTPEYLTVSSKPDAK